MKPHADLSLFRLSCERTRNNLEESNTNTSIFSKRAYFF